MTEHVGAAEAVASIERSFAGNIVQLKDPHSRDLMRGMLDRSLGRRVGGILFKLMNRVDKDDMIVADKLIRESPLFAHLPLREEFPRKNPPFLSVPDFAFIPPRAHRAAYVVHRGNANVTMVAEALGALDTLNAWILGADDQIVLAGLLGYADLYGHSIVLARKLAFVLGYFGKDTESWGYASRMFAQYGVDSNNFGMMALADSIGTDFNYLDIKSSFEEFVDCSLTASASRKLSFLSFNPIGFDAVQVADGLGANLSFSLLDAILYLLVHRELGLVSESVRFAEEIEDAWSVLNLERSAFREFFNRKKAHCDAQAFRAAPAFLEFEQLRNFRAATQRLFDTPQARAKAPLAPNPFEDAFYANVRSISDLLPGEEEDYEPLPLAFDRMRAGNLARSCGLTKLADRDPDFATISGIEMAALMGRTFEIDRLLSTAALRQGAKSADDSFVKLILYILLRAHSPATKDNYQFKHSFQEYVLRHHEGNIIAFLDEIRARSGDIVEYFITLLDETMLSQMPFLIETAEDVYETRAQIFEWFSAYSGDESVKAKAKQLRIDRKIAAVRGHINETRLNIDAVRFRQWIEMSKLSEFSGYIRQDAHKLPKSVNLKDRKAVSELRLSAHRDPNLRALVAVMDCYKEFCTNTDFGVASYLGRRIRHGTLRGTLLDGLPRPPETGLSQAATSQYSKWLEKFEQSIERITSKLHFSGKGASHHAVISSDIDSREKWDVLLVCLHRIFEKAKSESGTLEISLTIQEFCWYIFEIELRDVQEAIIESRDESGTFKLKHAPSDTEAANFERDVNIALQHEFTTVASWFRKPPNISPVAELSEIVTVVSREASAEFPKFEPTELVLKGGDLPLSGSVYYHIYDALSVIVRNAAKHGAKSGQVRIEADVVEQTAGRRLDITVVSQTRPGDSAIEAVKRMARAGLAGPAHADVVEGGSGVRKLEKMRKDDAIQVFGYKADPNASDLLVVTFSIGLSGFVE